MEIEIGITGLLLLLLAYLAALQLAFGQLSDVGLRRLVGEHEEEQAGKRSNLFLKEVLENRPRFRSTVTALIQILLVAVSVLVASISLRLFPDRPLLVAFVLGLSLTVVFRQLIPRLVSLRVPERTFISLLPLFRPFYRVFSFVAIPGRRSSERARRRGEELPEVGTEAEEETDADHIQALIEVGEQEGILEEEEGERIQTIIEFGETAADEVMTPRTDIVALPITATVREARDVMIESKYSRLPVYRDQIDNIEGIIYVRDLLACWPEHREGETIERLLRPAYFIPETKAVDDLLEEMQKAHVQLAMVIDEYGGVAGLVTVEDILEEIVGEIEDEDIESEEIVEFVESDEGYYDVPGSTEVGKIERLFGMEIEDDDFTTIAGLVINEEGRVPPKGTHLSFRGLDVEVLEADERRIGRLRLRRAESNNGAAGAG